MLIKADSVAEEVVVKECTKCKITKPLEEFYNNRSHKSGKTFWCKVCSNIQSNQVGKEKKAIWSAKTFQNLKRNNRELYLWKNSKRRAKEANLPFDIEITDIKIPEVCPYFGSKFNQEIKDESASLDRIDSSRGYTKDNIQVICFKANRLKSNLPISDLISFAKGVLMVHSEEVAASC